MFIETKTNQILFSASGDIGTCIVKIEDKSSEENNYESAKIINGGNHPKLQFLLRYLAFFTKASTLSKTINLSLSSDYPLLIQYDIEELGSLKFYLAPKIQD